MEPTDDALLKAAAAVADRENPGWGSLQSGNAPSSWRATVSALRAIAGIAQAHETLTAAGEEGSPAVDTALETGRVWAGLKVVERVGAGRFGDVYRAFDSSLDRDVALKILRHRDADAMDDALAVVEEGRLAARVRHPNVVTVLGARREDGRTGVWMEFVDGRTLEAVLAECGPFASEALRRVATALAGALSAVHAAGLVHRDVKTTNVMCDASGRIVLGDFGTGRLRDTADADRSGLAGTPQYLAPEVFAGHPATTQSDIYSAGVLLFRLATGRFPVTGRSLHTVRDAHKAGRSLSLRDLRPDLPGRITTAIDRALSADPADRFQSATELARAIRAPEIGIGGRMALGLGAVVSVAILALVWRGPAPDSTTSGIQIEHIDPLFQQQYALRGPSIDGRRIPCGPRGVNAVAICDLTSRIVTLLREPQPRTGFGTNAIWPSPNGSQLAYVWSNTTLAVTSADGGEWRDLYEGTEVAVVRWASDGSRVLVVDHQPAYGNVLMSVGLDRSVRDILHYDPMQDSMLDVSPDGLTVVASRQLSLGESDLVGIDVATDRDLWTFPSPGRDRWPHWTPDGQAVVFVSDQPTPTLRKLPIVNDRPGRPVSLPSIGRVSSIEPIGFSGDGSLYMKVTPLLRSTWVARMASDPRGATTDVRPLPATGNEPTMGGDWSPDGSEVAYLQGDFGSLTARGTVVIAQITGRGSRSIPLPGPVVRVGPTVRWSPDGRLLAVLHSAPEGGGWVLSTIDLRNDDRLDELIRSSDGESMVSPAWAPDSRSVYFLSRRGRDGAVRRVDLASHRATDMPQLARGSSIRAIDVASDGSVALAVAGRSQGSPRCFIRIVPPEGSVVDRPMPVSECTALAWTQDSTRLAVATQTGPARQGDRSLWLLDRTEAEPVKLPFVVSRVWDVSVHPNDRELLYTDGDAPFDIWRVRGIQTAQR